MKTGKMERFMKDLEILGLLVACVSINFARLIHASSQLLYHKIACFTMTITTYFPLLCMCLSENCQILAALPRSGPSRDKQCISIKIRQSVGNSLHDKHDGASPFRSVRHDSQLGGEQHFSGEKMDFHFFFLLQWI